MIPHFRSYENRIQEHRKSRSTRGASPWAVAMGSIDGRQRLPNARNIPAKTGSVNHANSCLDVEIAPIGLKTATRAELEM